MRRLITAFAFSLCAVSAMAQETTPQPDAPEAKGPLAEAPMTLNRLAQIITALDPEAQQGGASFQMQIEGIPILIVTDPIANRMRAMVPIRSAEGMSAEELLRVMQANFDTALDARYAVARGRLWATFIHPLSPLERDQFISGLVQTINIARTYGQTYSGGAQVFGQGDSAGIYQELFEELQKKGEAL